MKNDEEIINKLNQKIEEAQEADGFFIVVNHRVGEKLFHFQASIKFKPDDCILSLNEAEKLVREENPRTSINILKFKPRTHK